VREERHDLIRREDYNNKKCFVVESTPLNTDIKYGKRISWIDQQSFIPLKVDYWDKKGNLWKILQIEWQNKFGFFFFFYAKVENVQTNDKTFISVEDVRIYVEMDDRDFTRSGLDRQRHGLLGVKSQVP
jgi:hypothetical protein